MFFRFEWEALKKIRTEENVGQLRNGMISDLRRAAHQGYLNKWCGINEIDLLAHTSHMSFRRPQPLNYENGDNRMARGVQGCPAIVIMRLMRTARKDLNKYI